MGKRFYRYTDSGTKKELTNLNIIIKGILEGNEKARDSDLIVISEVYSYFGVDVFNTSLIEVLERISRNEIPNFESIRRSRQKIQELNEGLRSSYRVQDMKDIKEYEYREFALDNTFLEPTLEELK